MPSRISFQTVPDELLEYAELAVADFLRRGFRIGIEDHELGFPYTPTMLCKRQRTRIVVEVMGRVDIGKLEEWVAFGRSSGQDFRVAICVPHDSPVTMKEQKQVRDLGVGCYVVEKSGVGELNPPVDLALNVQLPELATAPSAVRELLGPAYEQFGRAQWREGFEDACQAFESESRKYLKRHSLTGRIKVIRSAGPKQLSPTEINKMTMGQLANEFDKIQNQNHADSLIATTLRTINKDRIGVVHHKRKKVTEKSLRQNVGRHMWSLKNAMKVVV